MLLKMNKRRKRHTEALVTAHENTVTEYGDSYFQGFEARSNSAMSCLRGGADVGIAFRPVDVMASGFDFENSGRMNDWTTWSMMNSLTCVCDA